MNDPEHANGMTVGDVLVDGSADTGRRTESLARTLSSHNVTRSAGRGLRHLSGSAMHAVTTQMAEALLKSLDLIDLKDLLVGGWRKYKDLTDAALRTLAQAGSEELVALAPHKIASTHRPSVDLVVHEMTVCTCTFDLTVLFDLNGVLAVVRSGKLAALRGGTGVISAMLAMGEVPLIPPREQRLDLTRYLTLSPGVPLLSQQAGQKQAGQHEVRGQPGIVSPPNGASTSPL